MCESRVTRVNIYVFSSGKSVKKSSVSVRVEEGRRNGEIEGIEGREGMLGRS